MGSQRHSLALVHKELMINWPVEFLPQCWPALGLQAPMLREEVGQEAGGGGSTSSLSAVGGPCLSRPAGGSLQASQQGAAPRVATCHLPLWAWKKVLRGGECRQVRGLLEGGYGLCHSCNQWSQTLPQLCLRIVFHVPLSSGLIWARLGTTPPGSW